MSLYAISDLHLALHPSLDKPMDVFNAIWTDHVGKLEKNWRSTVKEADVVLIPGDISWGINLEQAKPDLEFINSLPGTKVLLRGNHDYWWASMAKMRGLYSSIHFIQNDCFETDEYVICGCRGWLLPWNQVKNYSKEESEKIYNRELLRLQMTLTRAKDKADGRPIIAAMHFPPLDKDHYLTEFTKLFKEYGVETVVYGHLHGAKQDNAVEGLFDGITYHFVSLDKLDAKPSLLL